MIVSHFVVSKDERRLLVYRLLLTNLSRTAYYFRVTLRTKYWQLGRDVSYNVQSHSAHWIDTLQPAGHNRYRGRTVMPVMPRETVRIQIQPERRSAEAWIDVHGYVEVTIPPFVPGWPGRLEAQGTEAVPVLLHPSQVEWPSGTGYQDTAPVTISSGRAENEIMPDQLPELALSPNFGSLETQVAAAEAGDAETVEAPPDAASFIEDPRSVPSVIAYIGRVGEAADTMESMNELLRKAGHDVRLVTRADDGGQTEEG